MPRPSKPRPSPSAAGSEAARSSKGPEEDRELEVQELEERIAPRLAANQNQTVLTGD